MKARLAELQADRRNIYRQVGQHVYQILAELEDNHLARARRALFGDEQSGAYELLSNRLAFVQGGRDDVLFLDQYVLLGNYQKDEDRLETVDELFRGFPVGDAATSGRRRERTERRAKGPSAASGSKRAAELAKWASRSGSRWRAGSTAAAASWRAWASALATPALRAALAEVEAA